MSKRIRNLVVMLILVVVLALIPASAGAQQASPTTDKVSPEGLLNPDGTLRLDGKSSASLNLSGWDVRLDPRRGPMFLPPPAPLASPDVGHWEDIGTTFVSGPVRAIAVSGSNVYVGGEFTNLNGIAAADYIAKWNGANWSALGSNGLGNGSLNNIVYAIGVSGSIVYAGGLFTNVDPTFSGAIPEADYIAGFNGVDWFALGGNGSGNGSLDDAVYTIAVSGSDVYAGGKFTDANLSPAGDYIAKFNGSDWSPLGWNGNLIVPNGSLNGYVYAIAISGTDVYAGGNFLNVDPLLPAIPEADYIAKFNGSDWSALGGNGAGNGSLNGAVLAIAVSGSDVYAGGLFTNVDPYFGVAITEADYIAKFNGSDWSPLGWNGDVYVPNGSLNFSVHAIAISGTDVYAGGQFTNVDPIVGAAIPEADYIAKFDGSDWSGMGGDGAGNGSLNGAVYAIQLDANKVYVGGGFTDVNNNGSVMTNADYAADFLLHQTATFKSQGANDGWVLESTEISGMGGSLDSVATTFRVGDDAADKQYRSIVSFDTSSLPDTAVITRVTLKVKKQGLTGTDPFTTHGTLMAAIRKPYFGAAVTLANSDFQAALSKQVGFSSVPVSNWYSTNNNSAIWPYVNLTGTTQFRLRFTLDDNDNLGADYLRFYSGNAGSAYRPQLIVEYYVL